MRVSRQHTVVACGVCDRTLLLGEIAVRFVDAGASRTVCALCQDEATARGWRREGAPALPPVGARPRRPGLIDRLRQRPAPVEPAAVPRPVAERQVVSAAERRPERPRPSSERVRARNEQRAEAAVTAVHDGVDAFNDSAYRRTVSGISKSLGRPRVSVVPLGGIRPDVVVTVAWDLSWYQYRVDPSVTPPVRLEGRGDDARELEARWRTWNARTADDGSVTLA